MLIPTAKLTRDPFDMTPGSMGYDVALSADGVYALVSAPGGYLAFTRRFGAWAREVQITALGGAMALDQYADTAFIGNTARVYVVRHSGGTWFGTSTFECSGTTAVPNGWADIAISGDRSTLLVSDPGDSNGRGAVWVFVRENGGWIEQAKFPGEGVIGQGAFGSSLALSHDGNLALVGALDDDNQRGAVFSFSRNGGEWTYIYKLSPPPPEDLREQFGVDVAVSAHGERLLVSDESGAWTFLPSPSGWYQDGDKLPTSGAAMSVALSADGMTGLVGVPSEDGGRGAVWLLLFLGAIYKLTPTDEGPGFFGMKVAFAPDGNTAIIGGPNSDGGKGAAWVYVMPLSVTRLAPSSGSASGGTTVQIFGTGFNGARRVRFGPNFSPSFTVDGWTRITAVSPPGQPGAVDVRVTTSAGTSEPIIASRFTYT
jgi:hypothetical protein